MVTEEDSTAHGPRLLVDGVFVLYEPQIDLPHDFDIVFIHGLKSRMSSEFWLDTWRRQGSEGEEQDVWPKEWLPEDFPSSRVLAISYHSAASKEWGRPLVVWDIAVQAVQSLMAPEVGLGRLPFFLVGHSMGGLLAKELLLEPTKPAFQDLKLHKNCRGLLFYGVPHLGAHYNDNLASFFKALFFEMPISAGFGSEELKELGEKSLHRDLVFLALEVKTFSFVETLETTLAPGVKVMVLKEASAVHSFAANRCFIDADHFNLCKPIQKTDKSYRLFVDFVARQMQKEGRAHMEAVCEVGSHTDARHEQIVMRRPPLRGFMTFLTEPLSADFATLPQPEPSGTATGGRRSTKGQELCCLKCTHLHQKPIPKKKHQCPLKNMPWEEIDRATGRSSRGLRKRRRQGTLDQEPLPQPASNMKHARTITESGMEDASRSQYLFLESGETWNSHYCPKGVRLWLSTFLCAGGVQQGLLKTRLFKGTVICWKDAHKLLEAQGLNKDAQLRSLLGACEAEKLAVRILFSTCDSSLQPLSKLQPFQRKTMWLDGYGSTVGGECGSRLSDAGSWRPQCLVLNNSSSDFLVRHTEFVSGLEALSLDRVPVVPGCYGMLQRLRVLHLNTLYGATGLPEFLGSMSSLETLILPGLNDLSEFPAVIRKLSNLRQLSFENYVLAPFYLPDWLGELVRLETLHLGGLQLVLPSSVSALPSLSRLSLKSFGHANSLEVISNLQSLEKLSLRMFGAAALSLAITALTRLTTLKLLGTVKYKLSATFSIRCFPRLELLRLSGYLFKSLEKRKLPNMEKDRFHDFYEAKAPFTWAGAPQPVYPIVVNMAELGRLSNQHSPHLRGVASNDVEEAVDMEAVNEVGSDAYAEPELFGSAMPAPADSPRLWRPQPSLPSVPVRFWDDIWRAPVGPQVLSVTAPNVEHAHKTTPEGAAPLVVVDEVDSNTDARLGQVGSAMTVPAHTRRLLMKPGELSPLPLYNNLWFPPTGAILQEKEPSGTVTSSRRSTKGKELCCQKCTHIYQKPVPKRKHECPFKDKEWEDIERETGRSSHGLRKRGRQATLEQTPEPHPEPASTVEQVRTTTPDNKMVEKMRTVVSAMERLGEIPKMLEDMSKKFEPRDLQRMSIKMEDRYDALREELSGLCELLDIDITTMLRDKG